MRQLATFLLFALAVPALATEAWRWKDDKGVVHYSDTKVAGAERIDLPDPPSVGTVTPPAPRPPPAVPQPFKYTECTVLTPGNEQTFNAVDSVTASLQIKPPLQPGDRIEVFLDGNVLATWPARMLTFKLDNIYRGTHTLSVQISGAGKKVLCTGPGITFHVHQPSVLAPTRVKPKP